MLLIQFQIKNELLNVNGGKVNEHSLQNNENKEGSLCAAFFILETISCQTLYKVLRPQVRKYVRPLFDNAPI